LGLPILALEVRLGFVLADRAVGLDLLARLGLVRGLATGLSWLLSGDCSLTAANRETGPLANVGVLALWRHEASREPAIPASGSLTKTFSGLPPALGVSSGSTGSDRL
jgi:hypothetical protein